MSENVVELTMISSNVAQIKLQDKVNKNTFSKDLMIGLIEAFKSVNENSKCKVVILTGYDTYFATGGTQESLIAIFEGKVKFSDGNIYSLALECKVPVISAMQGHGVGGGFVFGMFSDFIILSRESIYTTNFMKYGFTPGMGATCILPKKLGIPLAQEMLFTARTFRGADLEKRGIPFPVLTRSEVIPYAYELAEDIAKKPRISLITLKDHMMGPIRKELEGVIKKEIEMHNVTFHQPEVRDRIMTLFGK